MLLEQLIEKKDLYIYLKYRILELQKAEKTLFEEIKQDKSLNKTKRLQHAVLRLKGSMRELRRLKASLETGRLKEECKRMWRPDDEVGEEGRHQDSD